MQDEKRPKDPAKGKHAVDDLAKHAPPQPAVETIAAAPLSFAAAAHQIQALTKLAPEAAETASIEGRARAIAQLRKDRESAFLRDGALTIEANALREELAYLRAVEAIRAKAAALGYGTLAQSTPIAAVPGGYVGRFGGNDIYAAAR